MTIKVSVYIAESVDGFIARPNGEIDWLTSSENRTDYGYAEFIASVDHIIMGRNTYEKVLTFDAWLYEKKVIVLTSRDLTVPNDLAGKVEALHAAPREVLEELEPRGARHIYLDGGATIQSFLRAGLVDEMTITTIPVLIGEGLPLFGALHADVKLALLRSESFDNGFVQNKYRVLR
jgi:dihydrofolate reductase